MTDFDISFKKMNGLGNDFVIVDMRECQVPMTADFASAIASRDAGVGCDQVIVLQGTPSADVHMRIFNADGSEVDACGNATRCVAALLGASKSTIETNAGVLNAAVQEGGLVSVDMGAPRFNWDQIPLSIEQTDTRAIRLTHNLPDGRMLQNPSVVNVGNPHCVFWVMDVESYDLAAFGPKLEHHPLFPERANISLAEVFPARMSAEGEVRDRIKLRVWERGAGLTEACGTAACAVSVAAHRIGETGRMVDVDLPGGTLSIEWRADDGHIIMTGPASYDFDGVLHMNGAGGLASFSRGVSP